MSFKNLCNGMFFNQLLEIFSLKLRLLNLAIVHKNKFTVDDFSPNLFRPKF